MYCQVIVFLVQGRKWTIWLFLTYTPDHQISTIDLLDEQPTDLQWSTNSDVIQINGH